MAMTPAARQPAEPAAPRPEPRLGDVRQLTSGGENAESVFLAGRPAVDLPDDAGRRRARSDLHRERGRIGTNARQHRHRPDDVRLFLSEWQRHSLRVDAWRLARVPAEARHERYVWPVYTSHDIYRGRLDGNGLTRLTDTPGYDAEATIAPTAASSSRARATATWRSIR